LRAGSPRPAGALRFADIPELAGFPQPPLWYSMRMKRTNLVLDEHLLEETLRLCGARTYSQAVNEAMAEYTRRIKARKILRLERSGLWEGNLSDMRSDRIRRRSRKASDDSR